jgi:hypothetical protein
MAEILWAQAVAVGAGLVAVPQPIFLIPADRVHGVAVPVAPQIITDRGVMVVLHYLAVLVEVEVGVLTQLHPPAPAVRAAPPGNFLAVAAHKQIEKAVMAGPLKDIPM